MDLEEWELLPDEGFLEINDDGGKNIHSRKHPNASSSVFHMNYFICPPKSVEKTGHHHHHHHHHPMVPPNNLLHVPIDLQPHQDQVPVEIRINPPPVASEKIKSFRAAADQDPVSQVFFNKMKETEFADMKMDSQSPKSSSSRRGIMPQLDFQFEGENGDVVTCKKEADNIVDHPETVMEKSEKIELDREDEGAVINIWKWRLTGISGAICLFGVTAVTFCIISFSSQRKNKNPQQNQKLQFRIYVTPMKR